MKKNGINILLLLFVTFAACSSPEKDGTSLGKKINKCNEDFLNALNKIEADFGKGSSYQTRSEAKQAYYEAKEQACTDYSSALGDVYKKMSETQRDYKDYKDRTKFEDAVEAAIDSDLLASATASANSSDVPKAVLAVIRTIVSPKPDVMQIQKDLLGSKLTEGFEKEKCWFGEDYLWTIGEEEIRNFNIEEVLRDDNKKYVFVATMRLERKQNAFDVRAKISYWLPDADDWELEFVNSMGVSIVKTHEYDDCVSYEIKDDGWGGIDALFIKNKTELELVVGVEIVASGRRMRRAVRVNPNGETQVGGLFCGGNVTSYEKGFVERF